LETRSATQKVVTPEKPTQIKLNVLHLKVQVTFFKDFIWSNLIDLIPESEYTTLFSVYFYD